MRYLFDARNRDGRDSVDTGDAQSQRGASGWITGLVLLSLGVWAAMTHPWIAIFVTGLLVSVFLHEMGHYVTARWTGMKVTQFYMGFGPRLWSRRRGDVEYGIRALPLGAYVRIIGMNSLDECAPEDEARTYRAQTYPRKMLVITAGSLVQLLLAFMLFAGIFGTVGVPGETGRVRVDMVGELVGGGESAAMAVGIRVGDVIVSIDGEAVSTQRQLTELIGAASPGDTLDVVLERDGETILVQPTLTATQGRAVLGVGINSYGWRPTGLLNAVGEAAVAVGTTSADAIRGVFVVFNPVHLVSNVTADVANPDTRPSTVVGASQVGGRIGEAAGLPGVLLFLASVNVVFAIINLFPLLPFDGGHAAIATYERLRSRKGRAYHADAAKLATTAMVTMVVMLVVFSVGLYLDITQPIG